MSAAEPESETEQSEDDSGFLLVTNAGVFAALNDRKADHDACNTVWNMLSKARGGGITRTLRMLAGQRSEETNDDDHDDDDEREEPMAKVEEKKPKAKRGEALMKTLEAYQALTEQLGRGPSAREVFDRLGLDVGKSLSNVSLTLNRLEARGDLQRGSKSGPKPKPASPSTVKTSRPAPRVGNGGGHHTSKGPLVLSRDFASLPLRPEIAAKADADPGLAAVIRKRNELADRVAQLTHVIETW